MIIVLTVLGAFAIAIVTAIVTLCIELNDINKCDDETNN